MAREKIALTAMERMIISLALGINSEPVSDIAIALALKIGVNAVMDAKDKAIEILKWED